MASILTQTLPSGFSFDLVLVEGGRFLMGDDNSEFDEEKPAHWVEVSSFYLGKYPVTQALWKEVMGGKNPSHYKGDNRPVEHVSWDDAQNFIKNLNAITGKSFRLPSEAEWEYAARGGRYSQGYLYAGSDRLKQVGWYEENSNKETKEVGLRLANELGIHDMSGNIWEWCEDDWHKNYEGAPRDGSPWINMDKPRWKSDRVVRGGSSFNNSRHCRSAFRLVFPIGHPHEYIGFRLVLPIQVTP
jgi:formylglycine-generating enzyme